MSPTACPACRSRCLLLGDLSPLLDYHRGRAARLIELLSLRDEELIEALGGRRRTELQERHRRRREEPIAPPGAAQAWCRHDSDYSLDRGDTAMAHLLIVDRGAERLVTLRAAPTVAILDSRRASGYGAAMASSLARALAAAGVTIIAGLHGPIGRSAHAGAGEVGAGAIGVLGDGLGACSGATATWRDRVAALGCVVSELPWTAAGRGWARVAGERIALGCADVAIVIETADDGEGLAAATRARELARPIGVMPGMVTNPLAKGPLDLIRAGARLIGNAADVLDLLHDSGAQPDRPRLPAAGAPPPPAGSAGLLAAVGGGCDTVEDLSRALDLGSRPIELLSTLGELESLGLLRRSAAGRYLRADPAI